MAAEGAPSCRRAGVVAPAAQRCYGGGCGLGRLVRRLRRQGRQALCAARPASASATLRGCQYDPLSYARNFDQSGGGGDADAANLYYSYTFSSRFVLASHPPPASSTAPTGLITSRPTATSH